MIIYNVTCNVERNIANEWLDWMKSVHIPEVMETGCFIDFKILRLLGQETEDEGINYAIQYTVSDLDTLQHYRTIHGPSLMAKTLEKYGEQVLAYRSVLEVLD